MKIMIAGSIFSVVPNWYNVDSLSSTGNKFVVYGCNFRITNLALSHYEDQRGQFDDIHKWIITFCKSVNKHGGLA